MFGERVPLTRAVTKRAIRLERPRATRNETIGLKTILVAGADAMMMQRYGSHELRRWALILYWITMFAATHWPEIDQYKPKTGWPIPYFEVVMHLAVYAGWVWMWWLFLSAEGRRVSRAAVGWILVGGVLWAGFDELSQAIVDRTPALDDFACDLIGLLLAVFILSWWQRAWLTTRRPPT